MITINYPAQRAWKFIFAGVLAAKIKNEILSVLCAFAVKEVYDLRNYLEN